MSLFSQIATGGRVVRSMALASVVVAGSLAGGCQIRPLYGTTSGELGATSAVAGELAAIDVESTGTDVQGRTLYNELVFNFERGAGSPDKRYNLKILHDTSTASVAVEQFSDVPSAYTITMNASFVLSDLDTGETLMTGKAFQSASFDFSSQRFANLRASRDAEERVAKALADDITGRVSGYFASRA